MGEEQPMSDVSNPPGGGFDWRRILGRLLASVVGLVALLRREGRASRARETARAEEMRPLIRSFFATHEAWLTALIRQGTKSGEFQRMAAPEKVAHTIFAALQGSLMVRRTAGEPAKPFGI